MKCSRNDSIPRLQGLVCGGVIHGLGRVIQGSLCIESGAFHSGRFVKGYRTTPLSVSYGHYNDHGLLTGRAFRVDVSGTFSFGTFADGLLHGVGLVCRSSLIYWGIFEHGSLVFGFKIPLDTSRTSHSYYFGPFYDYQPDGDGVEFNAYGATVGTWIKGLQSHVSRSLVSSTYTHGGGPVDESLDGSFELVDLQSRFEFMVMSVCRTTSTSNSSDVHQTYQHLGASCRFLSSFVHR